MIDEIKEYFLEKSNDFNEKYGYNYWENHVKYVTMIAKNLALDVGADIEIVQISAILHDIAKVLEEREEESHNIVGAQIAKELLKNKNYDDEKIDKVCKCILYHGGDLGLVQLTKEQWCVRNADILSMFNNITIFFYLAYHNSNISYEEGRELVKDMIYSKYNRLDSKLKEKYNDIFESIYRSI